MGARRSPPEKGAEMLTHVFTVIGIVAVVAILLAGVAFGALALYARGMSDRG